MPSACPYQECSPYHQPNTCNINTIIHFTFNQAQHTCAIQMKRGVIVEGVKQFFLIVATSRHTQRNAVLQQTIGDCCVGRRCRQLHRTREPTAALKSIYLDYSQRGFRQQIAGTAWCVQHLPVPERSSEIHGVVVVESRNEFVQFPRQNIRVVVDFKKPIVLCKQCLITRNILPQSHFFISVSMCRIELGVRLNHTIRARNVKIGENQIRRRVFNMI